MTKRCKFLKILLILVFIFQMLLSVVAGTEETKPDIWTTFKEAYSPRLDINLKGAWYFEDSLRDPEELHLNGNITAYLSKEIFSEMMLYIHPKIYFDPFFVKGISLFIEDEKDRPAFTLNEVFLSWYGDDFEIEAGKKIYSWKVADGFSPIDTLNPVDILDPLDAEKIGIPSISLLKMFESFSIQMVFIPFFVPDRQPDYDNRWMWDDPEARAKFKALYGISPVIVDAGRDLPDNDFDKMSVAARLSSSTLLSGWDLAVVYRYGYNTLGVIRSDIDPLSLPLVYLTTEYPSYHLFGFTFSTAWHDIEYHGEIGFHNSRNNNKDEDYLSYIIGINYTSYDWLSDWFEDIRFIAEYAGETITKKRNRDSVYSNKGASRGLTDNLIGRIEFMINQDHSVYASCIYNIDMKDSMLELKGSSQLNDYLKIIYGFQKLSGKESSFFGQWDDNDRFSFEILIQY